MEKCHTARKIVLDSIIRPSRCCHWSCLLTQETSREVVRQGMDHLRLDSRNIVTEQVVVLYLSEEVHSRSSSELS